MATKKDLESKAISADRVEDTTAGVEPARTEAESPSDAQAIPTEAETLLRSGEIITADARLITEPLAIRPARPIARAPVAFDAPEPVLTDATISFHTLDDDKDHDTHVTLTVRQLDGTVAARISNDFGHFPDHGDTGPFNLLLVNASPKSQLRSGNATIRIDPVGNDTWRFSFFLSLGFSDGTHLSSGADGLELTDERQQQAFGIA